ncbi:MAG: hypothetical protein S4CHLAM45_11100 [Chlamydiales bacterium]|nr:hypothetical protein [Chlamydiales bacterium]MCH9619602.1 hypothetical protein [Chlamydiales bacterium]MCH9623208.1 hypothetical protein [Chlamydiales bacterium]
MSIPLSPHATSVVFHDDAFYLAAGCEIYAVDTNGKRILRFCATHSSIIHLGLVGDTLVAITQLVVKMWDLTFTQETKRIDLIHTFDLQGDHFAFTASHLIIAKKMKLSSISTDSLEETYEKIDSHSITHLAASENQIASSDNKSIVLRNEKLEPLKTLPIEDKVSNLTLVGDQLFVLSPGKKPTVGVWDCGSCSLLSTFEINPFYKTSPLKTVGGEPLLFAGDSVFQLTQDRMILVIKRPDLGAICDFSYGPDKISAIVVGKQETLFLPARPEEPLFAQVATLLFEWVCSISDPL